MNPFEKTGDDKAEAPKPEGGAPAGDAATMVADAKASGKLKPLEDLMKSEGWDMDAGEALLLAQKKQAPGTQGKSPEELAEMMRNDPSIYTDLQELQPGGVLDGLEKKDPPPPSDEDTAMESEMGEYMGKSETLKGKDPKKGVDLMKKFGAKSPKDLDKDMGGKSSFLSQMG
jgi:hypothetical protein